MERIPLGQYRHFKGNQYEVIGLASHSETGEAMVVYRALYGEYGLWVPAFHVDGNRGARWGKSTPFCLCGGGK